LRRIHYGARSGARSLLSRDSDVFVDPPPLPAMPRKLRSENITVGASRAPDHSMFYAMGAGRRPHHHRRHPRGVMANFAALVGSSHRGAVPDADPG